MVPWVEGDKHPSSSPFFNKKEESYKEGHFDSLSDGQVGEQLTSPKGNDPVNTNSSGLEDLILTYAKEFSQGFTLSDMFTILTKSDSQFDSVKKDSLNQKLNRMAKRGALSKLERGVWCHPDYGIAARAADQVDVGKLTGQNSTSGASSYPLPRLKDLLMKKPKVLPEPLPFKWALTWSASYA